MTALLNRLKNGFEVLSHLDPSYSRGAIAAPARSKESRGQRSPRYRGASLDRLINEIYPLPECAAIIGASEDSHHFYIDLRDPSPGSILISGEAKSGKTSLLQSILASAVALNPHRSLRYGLLAADLSRYRLLQQQPHCYRAASFTSPQAASLIHELADLADSRRSSAAQANIILLAIDDLGSLVGELNDKVMADLFWLIQQGPANLIWPVVTFNPDDLDYLPAEMIQAFGTWLVGKLTVEHSKGVFSRFPAPLAGELVAGEQFFVLYAGKWLKFWIPDPGEV